MPYQLKQKLGAAILEWPRYEWRLRQSWLHICNRNERLSASPDGRGIVCKWRWTSDLHAAKVFSSLGSRLMRRSLQDWPIQFGAPSEFSDGPVQVSFVIGHRGMQRLPHLLATLSTIAAQRGVKWECIVVEQSDQIEIRNYLPTWVRYLHTPIPAAEMPYCRSWTLNVGARAANGEMLIFHDNDLLIPDRYAAESWDRYREGFEVINLKRFIFYLGEAHSARIEANHSLDCTQPPDAIMQNAEAGGSLAMARSAFLAIGGYDESFVGWGGEDNEFWERAHTRRVWPYGYLPIVHLWHSAQPEKGKQNMLGTRQFRELSSSPPPRRIAELQLRKFGDAERMDPEWSPQNTYRTVSHQQ